MDAALRPLDKRSILPQVGSSRPDGAGPAAIDGADAEAARATDRIDIGASTPRMSQTEIARQLARQNQAALDIQSAYLALGVAGRQVAAAGHADASNSGVADAAVSKAPSFPVDPGAPKQTQIARGLLIQNRAAMALQSAFYGIAMARGQNEAVDATSNLAGETAPAAPTMAPQQLVLMDFMQHATPEQLGEWTRQAQAILTGQFKAELDLSDPVPSLTRGEVRLPAPGTAANSLLAPEDGYHLGT